jgi:1-deoxy-D-xylulose-5-phosphate reductoisomerase
MKQIAVLGATGSIGTSCLEVVGNHKDRMKLVAITGHRNWEQLAQLSRQFDPRWTVISDDSLRETVSRTAFSPKTTLLFGAEGIETVAADPDIEFVMAGIVGAAGLRGIWAALEAGKTIGIANKETLVMAGGLVMETARRTGARLIPVDSEHSAVFQAMQAGQPKEVRRIVLTASGGPFRGWTADQLEKVTPEMALEHPTWEMGPKITIDSATMMNKALEVIEAKWLFDLDVDRIEVVVHPQSIIHSFVEFVDGSVLAQLSPPDMKLPIQYALTYPERLEGISPKLDWQQAMSLDFRPADFDAFPALKLGFEAAKRGGSCGAVLNAANEIAVERYLEGDLSFREIPIVCREILETHEFDPSPSLDDLMRLDNWSRKETRWWKS